MVTLASGLVMKVSFRQEKRSIKQDIRIRQKDFIDIKNKTKGAKEEMRLEEIETALNLFLLFSFILLVIIEKLRKVWPH